jgi:addiction module RelE/StbE family toxin
MAKINWTSKSIKDLKSLHDYIANDSKIYAIRFVSRVIERVEQLIEFPESGRVVPEKEDNSIRELIEGNYRIFYKLQKNKVSILRIHHSAKRIK